MKNIFFIVISLLFFAPSLYAEEPKRGNIIKKDYIKRVIVVDIGSNDGIKVGSAFVLHDINDRELACILAAEVEESRFISDLIPMGSFTEIEVGYHVEELGSGCRIEGVQNSYIPKGHFGMGDNKKDNETPMQGEFLDEYYIDTYEVTNEQYKIFLDDMPRPAPYSDAKEAEPYNWKDGEYPEGKEDYPVVLVTLEDAKEYCDYKGKRLPTEAQWEKAARGIANRIWPWGNVWDPKKLNNKESGIGGTVIIGSYPDDLSPYNVVDMGGNVSEWTSTIYGPYNNNYKKDENYDKGYYVVRGGSFLDGKIDSRTAARKFADPLKRSIHIGIRCVKDISESE